MRRAISALALTFMSTTALASTDPVADTRQIMAGTVTTLSIKNEYLSGKRDNTTVFQGALKAYKAVRAAEVPPPPPATQTCPDGSVILATATCPAPPPPPPPPPATQTCPDGSVILASAVCPAPPPPPPPVDPYKSPNGLTGETPIASNFDPAKGMAPSWGTGAIPPSASPDVVGAFRFICRAGQVLADDPIVYPGQPGKSHLHQFYGNLSADAFSTYPSLRANGASSCSDPLFPLNRSAYWQPAMKDGKGNVVRPDYVAIYYKRRPSKDPVVSNPPGTPVTPINANDQKYALGLAIPLPNGLKFIFGYDMLTGQKPTGSFEYICVNKGQPVTTQTFATLKKLADANICVAGMEVWSRGHSPTCWNGRDLDSANHRDHMAYAQRDVASGAPMCPKTHPYVIADFQLSSAYKIMPGDDIRLWSLSSDAMAGMQMEAGSTFHADFFMSWDPTAHAIWEGPTGCIERKLNCSGGDMGNGMQVKGASSSTPDSTRVIAISSIPTL